MTTTGQKLRDAWLRQGLPLRVGASHQLLASFEARHSILLPRDFREYLSIVDGQDEMDASNFRFWPLEEIKSVPEELFEPAYAEARQFEGSEAYFVFADFLIWSHAYGIRLSTEWNTNPVVLIGDLEPEPVAESFTAFAELYLRDPMSIVPRR